MSDIVEFIAELPPAVARRTKWGEVRATLAGQPGEWARIHAEGGYPRQALKALGCEIRTQTVDGETRTYARWPA